MAEHEQPRTLHLPRLTCGRGVCDLVAREGLPGKLHGEILSTQPQCDLAARQPFLSIHSPVPYAGVARGV